MSPARGTASLVIEAFIQGGHTRIVFVDNSFADAASCVQVFNGEAPVDIVSASAFRMGCGWAAKLPATIGRTSWPNVRSVQLCSPRTECMLSCFLPRVVQSRPKINRDGIIS